MHWMKFNITASKFLSGAFHHYQYMWKTHKKILENKTPKLFRCVSKETKRIGAQTTFLPSSHPIPILPSFPSSSLISLRIVCNIVYFEFNQKEKEPQSIGEGHLASQHLGNSRSPRGSDYETEFFVGLPGRLDFFENQLAHSKIKLYGRNKLNLSGVRSSQGRGFELDLSRSVGI